MKNIATFPSKEDIELWLSSEKITLETSGIYLNYWFHTKSGLGFGVAIVDKYSGEFHFTDANEIIAYLEDGLGNSIYNNQCKAFNYSEMLSLFESFKQKANNKNA